MKENPLSDLAVSLLCLAVAAICAAAIILTN